MATAAAGRAARTLLEAGSPTRDDVSHGAQDGFAAADAIFVMPLHSLRLAGGGDAGEVDAARPRLRCEGRAGLTRPSELTMTGIDVRVARG